MRAELNLHAPRCGVARACSDFEITDCVGALRRSRIRLGGYYNAPNTIHNGWLTRRAGPQRGLDGGSGYPPRCPLSYRSSVRIGMPGVCPAGCVGGQAAHPGSTRTPSPSVQLGAVGWSPQCPARARRRYACHVGTP